MVSKSHRYAQAWRIKHLHWDNSVFSPQKYAGREYAEEVTCWQYCSIVAPWFSVKLLHLYPHRFSYSKRLKEPTELSWRKPLFFQEYVSESTSQVVTWLRKNTELINCIFHVIWKLPTQKTFKFPLTWFLPYVTRTRISRRKIIFTLSFLNYLFILLFLFRYV